MKKNSTKKFLNMIGGYVGPKLTAYDRFFAKILRKVRYKKAPFHLVRNTLTSLAQKEKCSLSAAAKMHAQSAKDKELSTALRVLKHSLKLVDKKYKLHLKEVEMTTKKPHQT